MHEYTVIYGKSATLNTENIDSMLQWNEAIVLRVQDQGNVVVGLFQRAGELSNLTKLAALRVHINEKSYRQIKVAPFIENLPKLRELTFTASELSEEQIEEFVFNNEIPGNWTYEIFEEVIVYKRA